MSDRTLPMILALLTVGLALPHAAFAHEGALANRVANGGFELDLAGWLMPTGGCCANVNVNGPVDPAACIGDKAVVVRNAPFGGFVYQPVVTSINTTERATTPLLDFSANVFANPGNPGQQTVRVVDGQRLGTGAIMAHVTFTNGNVTFGAYGSSDGVVPIPGAAGCHHYQIFLTPDNDGFVEVALHVDGVHVASVAGDLGYAPQDEGIVQIGDLGSDLRNGAAPDVLYDGVHFSGYQAL